MKAFSVLLTFLSLLVFASADTVSEHFDLSKVHTIRLVDQHYTKDLQYFTPTKVDFTDMSEISELTKIIGGSETFASGEGPFIGHLCHFVMLNKDSDIIGMVSILNFNSLCDIHGAHKGADGRIIADYDKTPFGFTSEALARTMYNRLLKDQPAQIKKMDAYYMKNMNRSLKALLFKTASVEQDAAPNLRPR